MTDRTYIARLCVALIVAGLLWFGFTPSDAPFYGQAAIVIAALLAWHHALAIKALLWMVEKIYRWISALMMLAVAGIEGFMHLLNIPHMEGWWIPVVGGSGLFTGIIAWLRHRTKPQYKGRRHL